MPGEVFIILIVVITTCVAYLAGSRYLSSSRPSIAEALGNAMEYLGAFVMFFCVNVMLGVALIFLIRSVTPRFVSAYVLQDVTLVILSAIQAVWFLTWWRSG